MHIYIYIYIYIQNKKQTSFNVSTTAFFKTLPRVIFENCSFRLYTKSFTIR